MTIHVHYPPKNQIHIWFWQFNQPYIHTYDAIDMTLDRMHSWRNSWFLDLLSQRIYTNCFTHFFSDRPSQHYAFFLPLGILFAFPTFFIILSSILMYLFLFLTTYTSFRIRPPSCPQGFRTVHSNNFSKHFLFLHVPAIRVINYFLIGTLWN